MKQLLLAACLGCGLATAASAEECKVDATRSYYTGDYLMLEGTTTCRCATVTARAYDGDEFIGTSNAHGQGHAFTILIMGVKKKPANPTFKTDVEPEACN